MFDNNKFSNGMLYNKITEKIPELKNLSPNSEFELNIDKSIPIKIISKPMGQTSILEIDKTLFTEKTRDYFNKKFGSPFTKIEQIKRISLINLINLFKPLGEIISCTTKGDFKIE